MVREDLHNLMSYGQNFAAAISRLSAAFVSGNARTTFGTD